MIIKRKLYPLSGEYEVMNRITFGRNPEEFIKKAVIRFTQNSSSNRRKVDGGKYWEIPLIGFASGNDPLFNQYKKIIGKFHLTPREVFELTFGKRRQPEALSVISWVLPTSEDIRMSNRKEVNYPSLLWAHTRDFGEEFNIKLRNYVVSQLKKRGYRAVAPMNASFWRRLRSPRVGLASNWSERHVAYACGLGAFGLSDGLITMKGKAMRVGSVVTDLVLKPSEKLFPHHQANCLYYFNGTCQKCAGRCPAGAITEKGHDKEKCFEYTYGVVMRDKKTEYGVKIAGCGLCQTKVPCEFEIPKLIQKEYLRKK